MELPPPALQEGMVRVQVHCVGLNFADVFARLGVYPGIPKLPFVPGIEFSGIIREKSSGVRNMKVGTRVVGFSRQGAYAEEVCVPAQHLFPIPRAMSFEQGAAFLVTYLSAWHGLKTLAQVRKNETVLVHAAAGGVGTAVLQLGRAWGCRLIGTASSPAKCDVAREQGAEYVIDYVRGDFEQRVRDAIGGNNVDIVMDSVGGRVMKKSLNLLAPMGRYILYGFAAAAGPRRLHYLRLARELLAFPFLRPMSFPSRNISFMGFNLYFLTEKTAYLNGVAGQLLQLYNRKKIDPVIGKIFPFDEVVQAHTYLQSRKSVGKVLLQVL